MNCSGKSMTCIKKNIQTGQGFFLTLRILFALSFVLVGLYYELTAAVISAALLFLLLWKGKQDGLSFRVNDALLAVCGISLFYFLSCLWGVDSGLALWGGIKYLPLPLFGFCLMQLSADERRELLGDIPWIGGAMTVISFVFQFIPLFQDVFSVSGRLAGFFQYPNTFACFLLLGMELLLLEQRSMKYRWMRPLCGVLLLFGLFQAGSRTIFVLAVPALLICLLVRREKKTVGVAVVAVALGLVFSLILNLVGGIGGTDRILEISSGASTLLGRILYWKDALPVIITHPFGMGYLGYYFSQGSFQTGVYSVRWVHNDFLQLLLDVGWIPAALAAFSVFRALFVRKGHAGDKIIFVTLLVHCMIDFDLEFVAMYFILLLCLHWDDLKSRTFRVAAIPGTVGAAALGVFGLYIGVASAMTYAGNHTAAVALYPWNTLSQMESMSQISDVEEMEELADSILERNSSVALAWDAKALAAYAGGDFGTMITAKREAISLSRYDIEGYEDYFEKLRVGYELYSEAGDAESAAVCLSEIQGIQIMLDDVEAQTDPLAWRLADTPELEMPESYREFLEGVDTTGI